MSDNTKQSEETYIRWSVNMNSAIEVGQIEPEPILTIHPDGRVTTSDRLKPTEAAAMVLDQIKTAWLKDAQATKIRELQEYITQLENRLRALWDKYYVDQKHYTDRIKRLEDAVQERDKEWFQVIESILGFHPVSMTEALRIGIERIKKQKQRIKRLDEENNELRAEEARLLNTKGELERRIKRLEEGGDRAILNSYLPDRIAMWNKAKEAKL